MKNQRGVTLVELLVVIVIMGAIFVPISMMLNYSLKTEKDVSEKTMFNVKLVLLWNI